jgi:hypothetical protein
MPTYRINVRDLISESLNKTLWAKYVVSLCAATEDFPRNMAPVTGSSDGHHK